MHSEGGDGAGPKGDDQREVTRILQREVLLGDGVFVLGRQEGRWSHLYLRTAQRKIDGRLGGRNGDGDGVRSVVAGGSGTERIGAVDELGRVVAGGIGEHTAADRPRVRNRRAGNGGATG